MLTCGARARSVGAGEIVGRGSDVGRRDESARECRGAIGAGQSDDESWRAGRVVANTGRRETASGPGSERSGPVQGGLGQSGPVWVVLGRSGPWWAGSDGPDRLRMGWTVQADWTGRGRAGLDRLGPDSVW